MLNTCQVTQLTGKTGMEKLQRLLKQGVAEGKVVVAMIHDTGERYLSMG